MSYLPLSLQCYNLTTSRPKYDIRQQKTSMSIIMVDFGLHDLCSGIIGKDIYSDSRTASPESSSSSAIYYPNVYCRPAIQMPNIW